jgi:uncharacterized repeat protein (TIGR01451 family)
VGIVVEARLRNFVANTLSVPALFLGKEEFMIRIKGGSLLSGSLMLALSVGLLVSAACPMPVVAMSRTSVPAVGGVLYRPAPLAPRATGNMVTVSIVPPLQASCFATLDGVTVYSSTNASAVQQAVDIANVGDLVKVAGTCAGVQTRDGLMQTVYLSKTLTLRGGYTQTDWLNSYPITRPTKLDAQSGGRVVTASVDIAFADITIQNGRDVITGSTGAGIHAGGALTLSNVSVLSNTETGNDGGGAYVKGAAVITGGRFENNVCTHVNCGGGGLAAYGLLTLTGTQFISNVGYHAGGVYANMTTTISAAQFISNTADDSDGQGGGLMSASAITVTGSQFTNNSAGQLGGGIEADTAITLIDTSFSANSALSGGGVYLNSAANVLSGTQFSDNWAWLGGGVYAQGAAVVSGAQFTHNYAQFRGGGMSSVNDLTIVDTQFISNTSQSQGAGGLFAQEPATLSRVQFINNDSIVSYGGGMQASSAITLTDVQFISNTAGGEGGGMIAFDAVNMNGAQFINNDAGSDGGGLYINKGDSRIVNALFARNNAANRGAALYLYDAGTAGGTADLVHTTIASPTLGAGAAVYVGISGSRLNLTNTLVVSYTTGITAVNGVTVTSDYNLFFNAPTDIVTGSHSLSGADPLFVDPPGDDYHLLSASPALEKGLDLGITRTLDGYLRPVGRAPAIGAYEMSPGLACDAVSGVQIVQQPEGVLLAGGLGRFSASATGSLPFSYTWTINGDPVGLNLGLLEHTFMTSGTYTMAVSVTNMCSSDNASLGVNVVTPDPQQGNLSKSSKMTSRTSVTQGDVVTYTILLRNTLNVTASTLLTDVVPTATNFVSGSLNANLGTAMYADGRITWAGNVVSGTPAVIVYAVTVSDTLAPGSEIVNTALVDDGSGNLTSLSATSIYQPAFNLLINDAATYTRLPTVTLGYSFTAPGIVDVRFSNDAGFLTNSDWISVSEPYQYPDWVLDTPGDLTVPRSVYAQFRDAGGTAYPPVHASILYDPEPPAVIDIQVITVSTGSALKTLYAIRAGESFTALVRITSQDANSGVSQVILGGDPDLSDPVTYTLQGGASLDVIWPVGGDPFQRPYIYAQVDDRAGNASAVGDQPLIYRLFLINVVKD